MKLIKTKRHSLLLNGVIVCVLISSLTYNVRNIQMIGMGAATLAVMLLLLEYVSYKDWMISSRIFIPSIILVMVYLFSTVRVTTFGSTEKILSLLYSLCLLITISKIDIRVSDRFMSAIFLILCIVAVVPSVWTSSYNIIDGGYKSIYTTTTFMGIFSCIIIEYCYLLYLRSKNKIWWFYIAIFAMTVWRSKVRTAYIGFILIAIVIVASRYGLIDKMKRGILKLGEYATWLAIITFTIIYPNLERFSWYNELSAFVYTTTGKILMSGRNIIWKEAFDMIMENPLFGHGIDITNIVEISVHNSYIQCMLQFGLVGTISFAILIHQVLKKILKNNGTLAKVIYFFTIVNLIMSTTEVMILQGQLIIQILIWALMGIGMNKEFGIEYFDRVGCQKKKYILKKGIKI